MSNRGDFRAMTREASVAKYLAASSDAALAIPCTLLGGLLLLSTP